MGFLIPSLLVTLLFLIYPIYLIVDLSLREGKPSRLTEISQLPLTLGNYSEVLSRPEVWRALWTTVVYATATVTGAVLVGLVTALLLRRKLPARRFWRTLIMMPWPIPGAIATVAFVWMLDGTYGVVNYILRSIGLIPENIAWFFLPQTAMIGVLAPTIWIAYPVCTLILLAGLHGIPDELYEAARIDGASSFQQFRYITWPGLSTSAALAIIITALWCFTTFDFVYAITRGGPNGATETLAVAIYNEAFRFFRLPEASALGVVTIIFAALVVLLFTPMLRRRFH